MAFIGFLLPWASAEDQQMRCHAGGPNLPPEARRGAPTATLRTRRFVESTPGTAARPVVRRTARPMLHCLRRDARETRRASRGAAGERAEVCGGPPARGR